MPILLKLFQRTEREGTLTNSVCEASITLLQKPHNNTTTKKNVIDQYLTQMQKSSTKC
jgi:hypothetical protein